LKELSGNFEIEKGGEKQMKKEIVSLLLFLMVMSLLTFSIPQTAKAEETCYLDIHSNRGHSSVYPHTGLYEYPCGSDVFVTAFPTEDYDFWYWEINNEYSYSNPVRIRLDGNYIVRAFFKYNITIEAISVLGFQEENIEFKMWNWIVGSTPYSLHNLTTGLQVTMPYMVPINSSRFLIFIGWSTGSLVQKIPIGNNGFYTAFYIVSPMMPLIGDVNLDDIVDMTDLGMIAMAYGSSLRWNPPDPRYHPALDIDSHPCCYCVSCSCRCYSDELIDMTDLGIAGMHYGDELIETHCNYCHGPPGSGGDGSLVCGLFEGNNTGLAVFDEEWYWFNCGGVGEESHAYLTIYNTNGGVYELYVKDGQLPYECPQSTDICVPEGVEYMMYCTEDSNYWVLARRVSGPPGFKITLDCVFR